MLVRPARCSLSSALQAEDAEIGTLYRTRTGVRVDYGPPAGGEYLVSETFEIYADGQEQPDHGAWTYTESLHFGVILISPPTAPTTVTTTATAPAQTAAETAAAGSPTIAPAPAPAAAPAGTTTAETPAEKKRHSPASRRTQHGVTVIAEADQPAKLGHGATAGYLLGPHALGGVKHGNHGDGDHVRLKRGAAPSTQIAAADRKYKLVNRGGTKCSTLIGSRV